MTEARGDLFRLAIGGVLCITTNGFVKANGQCVMGRGCAAEAKSRWPTFPGALGQSIQQYGNKVHHFQYDTGTYVDVVTFPVKHNWWEKADLDLIARSAVQLRAMADGNPRWNDRHVYLPRPGCGNGRLLWTTVKAVIEPIFDDRFVIVDFA